MTDTPSVSSDTPHICPRCEKRVYDPAGAHICKPARGSGSVHGRNAKEDAAPAPESPASVQLKEALDDLTPNGPYELHQKKLARSRIESLFASLESRVAEMQRPAPCGVCGGSGRPTSGLPCICDGAGTEMAELQGFREHCYNLESELALLREINKDLKREAILAFYNGASVTARRYILTETAADRAVDELNAACEKALSRLATQDKP